MTSNSTNNYISVLRYNIESLIFMRKVCIKSSQNLIGFLFKSIVTYALKAKRVRY